MANKVTHCNLKQYKVETHTSLVINYTQYMLCISTKQFGRKYQEFEGKIQCRI